MASMTSRWSDFDFDSMCDKLRARDNFSFSRFGDGEWAAVLGMQGCNCDGHRYFPELSCALAVALLSPQRYYMGMQPKAMRDIGDAVTKWCRENECGAEWCDADIIHDASIEDKLNNLWLAMKGRPIVLVGPKHLKPLAGKMGAGYVFVPDRNCWKWYTTIYADIVDELSHSGKDTVVLYCASMTTEILIDKAFCDYGTTITQIDVGSALDPYCGKMSRRYHGKIIERLKESA